MHFLFLIFFLFLYRISHQMQTTNVIKNVSTLPKPRHNPTNFYRKSNEEIAAQHVFSSSLIGNNNDNDNNDNENDDNDQNDDDDDYQRHFLSSDKQQNKMILRPTYGAYTNSKTLPRGPYLQYKYNDRQQLATATIPATSAAATRTTALTINHNNIAECFDNNKLRQNRQIEQLKNEFIHLPRARVSANDRKLKNDEFTTPSSKLLSHQQKSLQSLLKNDTTGL